MADRKIAPNLYDWAMPEAGIAPAIALNVSGGSFGGVKSSLPLFGARHIGRLAFANVTIARIQIIEIMPSFGTLFYILPLLGVHGLVWLSAASWIASSRKPN